MIFAGLKSILVVPKHHLEYGESGSRRGTRWWRRLYEDAREEIAWGLERGVLQRVCRAPENEQPNRVAYMPPCQTNDTQARIVH